MVIITLNCTCCRYVCTVTISTPTTQHASWSSRSTASVSVVMMFRTPALSKINQWMTQ